MISEGQKYKNIFVWNHSACENAIIQKCRKSNNIKNIFFANKNSISMTKGIIPVKSIKEEFFKELKENNVNIILANAGINNTGFLELCVSKGFECIGADRRSCISEKSKIFSKNLMKKYGITTAPYIVLEHPDEINKEIKNIKFPTVIKANGYAKSLSAVIVNNPKELFDISQKYLGGYFNDASKRIIIEDCVMDKNGTEVSVPLICDGKTLKVINFVRDYKRHLDGDLGSNTGSMGSYCPYILSKEQKNLIFELVEKLQTALSCENLLYKGFMTINVIINDNKAYLLEINTRLGDSEGQVVLELIENDICELFEAILSENIFF